MINAIVYSKNRACQLDLLLRSIEEHATELFDRIHILWRSKRESEYYAAYRICELEHPDWDFLPETDLRGQTLYLAENSGEHLCFLTDDSVFYRRPDGRAPAEVLCEDKDVLCFSLRLGLNCTYCYPLARMQKIPVKTTTEDGCLYWDWQEADADWAYPGSLDGHLFRRDDLLPLLRLVPDWRTPNTLEAGLVSALQRTDIGRPLMAAHAFSSLVGLPLNRTSETHTTNRAGIVVSYDPAQLNRDYLDGKRARLGAVMHPPIAAHTEWPLELA